MAKTHEHKHHFDGTRNREGMICKDYVAHPHDDFIVPWDEVADIMNTHEIQKRRIDMALKIADITLGMTFTDAPLRARLMEMCEWLRGDKDET